MSPAPRQDDEWGAPIGGAVDILWKDVAPGTVIIGVWQGVERVGKYPSGLLEVDGVPKKIAFPKVLEGALTPMPIGARVRIKYLGMGKNQGGTEYHKFDIRPAKGVLLAPPPPPAAPVRRAAPSTRPEPEPENEEDKY